MKVLDATYRHQTQLTGYGLMLPGYTACLGSDIKRILPKLRTADYDKVTLEKWAYFLQVAARAACGEGY